jgi:broad specificity phosphatase PhoE
MSAEQTATTPAQYAEMLGHLFETSEAGRKAATSLSKDAFVAVRFTDFPGDYRFHAIDGRPLFEAAKAEQPDFELTLPPGAVRDICGKASADVGDLGVLFLQHIFAKEPEKRILVKVHSGLIKLTLHGWLRVVIAGCPKLITWVAKMGLKGPSAVASVLSRLKDD